MSTDSHMWKTVGWKALISYSTVIRSVICGRCTLDFLLARTTVYYMYILHVHIHIHIRVTVETALFLVVLCLFVFIYVF